MKITDNNLHQAIAALRKCAKENEGCGTARHLFYEAFKNEALCALCY